MGSFCARLCDVVDQLKDKIVVESLVIAEQRLEKVIDTRNCLANQDVLNFQAEHVVFVFDDFVFFESSHIPGFQLLWCCVGNVVWQPGRGGIGLISLVAFQGDTSIISIRSLDFITLFVSFIHSNVGVCFVETFNEIDVKSRRQYLESRIEPGFWLAGIRPCINEHRAEVVPVLRASLNGGKIYHKHDSPQSRTET